MITSRRHSLVFLTCIATLWATPTLAEPEDSPAAEGTEASENSEDAERFESKRSGPGIGFAAGALSGLGFTYRQHFPNGMGFNLGGLGWGSPRSAFANIGGTLNRTFARSRYARFYGLVGTMLVYNGNTTRDPLAPPEPVQEVIEGEERPVPEPTREPSERWVHTFDWLLGAGVGIEFHFTQNLGLALELPLSIWFNFDRDGFQRDEIDVVPFPNAALVYYFD
jgi:hypothetical protein